MRNIILVAILVASAGTAAAQSSGTGQATSGSQSGSQAVTGPISFGDADPATRVSTTPPVYTAPSMFGQGTCGQSNTFGASITGFGIGGSSASEDKSCNARADAAAALHLGKPDIAQMRFFCFGADANRMAYEATGGVCPRGATANGIQPEQRTARTEYLP